MTMSSNLVGTFTQIGVDVETVTKKADENAGNIITFKQEILEAIGRDGSGIFAQTQAELDAKVAAGQLLPDRFYLATDTNKLYLSETTNSLWEMGLLPTDLFIEKQVPASGTIVYAADSSGQKVIPAFSNTSPDTVVLRDSVGNFTVHMPTVDAHPAAKKYVDDRETAVREYVDNEIDLVEAKLPLTIASTDSTTLSGTGRPDSALTANVRISSDTGQQLSVKTNGLYVGLEPLIVDEDNLLERNTNGLAVFPNSSWPYISYVYQQILTAGEMNLALDNLGVSDDVEHSYKEVFEGALV